MNELRAPGVSENRGDLARPLAHDSRCLVMRVGNQATAEIPTVECADRNRISAVEGAFDTDDASGEEALSLTQSLLSAAIDDDRAARLQIARNPALAGRDRIRRRDEPRARCALGQPAQGIECAALGD